MAQLDPVNFSYRYRYLAAQGWSLHRSGGGCFGFSKFRQRLSLTTVWLLSRMHFRIAILTPASEIQWNHINDTQHFALRFLSSNNLRINSSYLLQKTATSKCVSQIWYGNCGFRLSSIMIDVTVSFFSRISVAPVSRQSKLGNHSIGHWMLSRATFSCRESEWRRTKRTSITASAWYLTSGSALVRLCEHPRSFVLHLTLFVFGYSIPLILNLIYEKIKNASTKVHV